MFLLRSFVCCFGLALLPVAGHASQVVCHYTYGGETRQLVALPVSSPYAVQGIAVGSYFHFRVVFQRQPADLASVKVYTYADLESGPTLIHQATYPYSPGMRSAAPYGFTGLHFVHEPVRDGELQYWCGLQKSSKPVKQVTP
jgi:hypothetical protein